MIWFCGRVSWDSLGPLCVSPGVAILVGFADVKETRFPGYGACVLC